MSKDQSEEKTLPASQKKLRDARKKGQVSQSKDMVIGVGTVATLAYLWIGWDRLQNSLTSLILLPHDTYNMPFMQAVDRVVGSALDLAALTVLPLIALVLLSSVLTNVAVMQGFVFSTDPIKPKGDNINPVSGFKRLFSIKNLIELIKSILKTALLTAVGVVLVWLGLETLVKGPVCGPDCIAFSFAEIVKPLFIAFALIFLLFALFDVGVQRWLFLREMRMTKTEFKRERKDMDGDPMVRQERNRQRNEMAQGSGTPLGLRHSTILIADHAALVLVGVRYVRGETSVPVITCKARNERATALIAEARKLHLTVIDNKTLAQNLARTGSLGDNVAEEFFNDVAQALVQGRR